MSVIQEHLEETVSCDGDMNARRPDNENNLLCEYNVKGDKVEKNKNS
jgi:hypothetical protein